MALVSIIVPVYNVEKYLAQCLESLISQTLYDIEIVCVNDCSPDNSLSILQQYAKKDKRIKIINKTTNEGLALARKDGIANSTGDYVCFIDSDDYAEKTMCEILYTKVVENSADIAECSYRMFGTNKEVICSFLDMYAVFDKSEFIKNVFYKTIVNGKEAVVVWNKIYKRELINNVVEYFGKSPLEDYVFNLQYYSVVKKYVYVPVPLINYRITPNSLSRSYNPNVYSELTKVQTIKEKTMSSMGILKGKNEIQNALWFYNYTMSYLKNNIVILKDGALASKILCDDVLKNMSSLIQSKTITARFIYKRKTYACMFLLYLDVPYRYFKRALKFVLKK